MSSGFNSDVKVGEQVFHVQTEDRGPARPILDTAVYQNGRVVLRRTSNYQAFAASSEFSPEGLRERVELQHRETMEDLRAGRLDEEINAARNKAAAPTIQVKLLNPGSWLSAGTVSLDVEAIGRADNQPVANVQVNAEIEGAAQPARHSATTDAQGRAQIQFPLPLLGQGDLALVIQAKHENSQDEIRFAMRSRAKAPSASSAS